MKRIFGTTAAIEEAAATTKRQSVFKALLIFIAVFYASSMLSGVITAVPMIYFAFSNETVMDLILSSAQSGIFDVTGLSEAMMNAIPTWPMLYSTILVTVSVVFYCVKIERRRIFTLGFTKKGAVTEYISGLLIGLLMFSAVMGIIVLTGQGQINGFNPEVSIGTVILFFFGFVIQGMSEEVLVRSYFFVTFSNSSNVVISVFASSAIFALLHIFNPGISVLAILNLFLFGVFAALYFLRRGSIWGISAIHTIWNFAQGNLFGCEVSGLNAGDSILTSTFDGGNTLINGGAFGPEGGLGVTIILFIGIAVLLFMKNKHIEAQQVKSKDECCNA